MEQGVVDKDATLDMESDPNTWEQNASVTIGPSLKSKSHGILGGRPTSKSNKTEDKGSNIMTY